MINLVVQPKDSSICGHCCVAMITGKPLEDVIKVIGHQRGTRTKEIHKALAAFGIKTKPKLTRFTNHSGLPSLGIVKITYDWRKNNGHWMVIKDFVCYCPGGTISHWTEYLEKSPKGRLTSFLTINP
jgi:hypothetical protein